MEADKHLGEETFFMAHANAFAVGSRNAKSFVVQFFREFFEG
jgi:hypothetical protein